MECPICKFPDLKDGDIICPKCSSDIEAFGLISSINKSLRCQKRIINVLIIVLILLLAGSTYLCMKYTCKSKQACSLKKQARDNAALIDSIAVLNERINMLSNSINQKSQVAEKNNNEQPVAATSSDEYVVVKGDNLSEISRTQLGDVSKYKKIADDNGIVNPDIISAGQKLKINK